MRDIIRYYTREAGVRNMEREIANLARKSVKEILVKKLEIVHITRRNLEKYAGVKRFRYGEVEPEDLVGVTTGLGMDGSRRRIADDRSRGAARQGQDHHHRQARRRDEGIGAGGRKLRQGARDGVRHQADASRKTRYPCPRSRRRDAERRAERGRCHGDLHRFRPHRHSGAQRRGDDRRNHVAWPRAADRRA